MPASTFCHTQAHIFYCLNLAYLHFCVTQPSYLQENTLEKIYLMMLTYVCLCMIAANTTESKDQFYFGERFLEHPESTLGFSHTKKNERSRDQISIHFVIHK